MKTQITLQERLRDLRFEKGLKLEELSAQTGISTSALSNYENNDYKEISWPGFMMFLLTISCVFQKTEITRMQSCLACT